MKKRTALILTAAAITGGVFVSTIVSPPEVPPRTVTLSWQHPGGQGIVFNVWSRTNLATGQWQLSATVTNLSCTLPMRYDSEFFTVTASNVVTGMESSKLRN